MSAWLRLALSRLGIIQTSLASPLAAPSLGRISTSRTASFCFSSIYLDRCGFAEDWLRFGKDSSKLSLCAHLAQSLCILEKQNLLYDKQKNRLIRRQTECNQVYLNGRGAKEEDLSS